MGRAMLQMTSAHERNKAKGWIDKAPYGARITFQSPARSTDQNGRMWVILTHIAEQVIWDGKKHSTDRWKDYFMGVMNSDDTMTAEEGPPIAVGRSTSSLSKEEHSLLTEIMVAFADRQGVVIPDQEQDQAA